MSRIFCVLFIKVFFWSLLSIRISYDFVCFVFKLYDFVYQRISPLIDEYAGKSILTEPDLKI